MIIKRKTFFRIHSWIGIRLSILFFIVCFSGTLATLSHEMDWLFIPEIRVEGNLGEWASRNTIVKNFKEDYPKASIEFWLRTDEPYLCDIIYKLDEGQRSYVFANPHTGEIQGEVQLTFQRFFRDLHYFLFIPFQIGHFTVLIFGFLLLISLITALVFYKRWWRKLFDLKIGKGPLVFFRSLHRLVGLWSVPFTLLFSITGIWYFLERTNTGNISKIANTQSPEAIYQEGNVPPRMKDWTPMDIDYDRAVQATENAIPGITVGDILPAKTFQDYIYVTGHSNVPLVRQRANRVYLDPVTYTPIKIQNAEEINTITWLNDIADPLHFGYFGGLITKIIWFILGLGISSLVLTGIWITLKRKALKRKKDKKKVMGAWRYINWGIYGVMLFFMYYIIIDRYQTSLQVIGTISLGWAIFLFLAWYIFVYRLRMVVKDS